MAVKLLDLGGEALDPRDLSITRASDLAARLSANEIPYATLRCCLRVDGEETVVAEVEVEIPQRPVHDICRVELIAFAFDAGDERLPRVMPLRLDFPSVPHLNITLLGEPKTICLFEEPYIEIRPRLTTPMLMERVREWLRLTARGELHAADQPLEPLLVGAVGRIIVPRAILAPRQTGEPPIALTVSRREDWRGGLVLVAKKATRQSVAEHGPLFVVSTFWATPRSHGILRVRPRSLRELNGFLLAGGDDLLGYLRNAIIEWHDVPRALAAYLVLMMIAPKTRSAGGAVESHDVWAFVTAKTVGEVGVEIGVFQQHQGIFGRLLPIDVAATGADVRLDLLNVATTLSREDAARLSGRAKPDDRRVLCVGAGALGSQIALNAARIAYGRWTLVDRDLMLPHNVARHALPSEAVGFGKSLVVSAVANDTTDADEPTFTSLVADVLCPDSSAGALNTSLASADLIVDTSASIVVARHLAREIDSKARRMSVFLNPRGTDLVLLSESSDRRVRLDVLEMQYYRSILRDPALDKHLEAPADRVRYGRSCRDVSVRISQEFVAQHAAIATRAMRSAADAEEAHIRIWQINRETSEVTLRSAAAEDPTAYQVNGWAVLTDEGLRRRLTELRSSKLPRETGGVLVGTFDLEKRIVYVIDTLASPPDSEERPTWFIRGSEGLPADVAMATEITGGQAEYIGEWHSHPQGHSCHPSIDDAKLFAWLTHHMDVLGLPAVMMIVGDDGSLAVFVGAMVVGELRDEHRIAVVQGIVGSAQCSN